MKEGWIKLHRSELDSPLFRGRKPLCEVGAWFVIKLEVNHSPAKVLIGGREITCNAGESLNSLETWGKLFRWDKQKVRRFFKKLQNCGMIETKSESKTTRLTVCKCDSYEGERHQTDTIPTPNRHDTDTIPTPNKNEKKEKNDKNEINQQATGFEFEKLSNEIGRPCAKLMIEGSVLEKLPPDKQGLILEWLKYKNEKGHPVNTTSELFKLLTRFQDTTAESLKSSIEGSISNGYKGLIESKPERPGNTKHSNSKPQHRAEVINKDRFETERQFASSNGLIDWNRIEKAQKESLSKSANGHIFSEQTFRDGLAELDEEERARFEFEKLSNEIGRTCAKLFIEGSVLEKLPPDKQGLMLKWLNYKNGKGHPVSTDAELLELLTRFQNTTAESLKSSIEGSISNGYKGLIESKPERPGNTKQGASRLNLDPYDLEKTRQNVFVTPSGLKLVK